MDFFLLFPKGRARRPQAPAGPNFRLPLFVTRGILIAKNARGRGCVCTPASGSRCDVCRRIAAAFLRAGATGSAFSFFPPSRKRKREAAARPKHGPSITTPPSGRRARWITNTALIWCENTHTLLCQAPQASCDGALLACYLPDANNGSRQRPLAEGLLEGERQRLLQCRLSNCSRLNHVLQPRA